jgi:FkbM family methyltransferase
MPVLGRRSSRRTGGVSDEEIDACYQLLLGRPADAAAMDHYRSREVQGSLTHLDVVRSIVDSPEYAARSRIRQPEPESTVVDGPGFRIRVLAGDWAIGRAIALTGTYEHEVTEALQAILRPGSVFLDVGANYGWHSLLAAGIAGPEGRVVSVEPNPQNAGLLRRSAEENGFSNLEVVVAAAAEEDGVGALETDGSNGRIISVAPGLTETVACSYVVPLRRLDGIVAASGGPRVDVVKIDVEGFEVAALRGAAGLIERDRPTIVSEFFPKALRGTGGVAPETYLQALRALGYHLSVIGRSPTGAELSDEDILAPLGPEDHVDLLAEPA